MSNLIVNLWKSSGIYTRNRWQKGVGNAVGEADDNVPLQLKTRVVSHRVVQALIPVVGYKKAWITTIIMLKWLTWFDKRI
jgi:hypothetical protein